MKVSLSWLRELVDFKQTSEELAEIFSQKTIATKEVTEDFIELDMKGYNRADLLSLRGVAYEVGAITDSPIKFTETEVQQYDLPEVQVEVADKNLAPLYCLAKIEGLKVSTSPDDWKKKLSDCGIRSINNVADVTNLVMIEYGQPLHAFSASEVKDESIMVRLATPGETLQTLDGKSRKLEATDLVIADSEKALGIAGVMGGQNSEITDSTSSILLEAAIFDPITLRKTASRLGLSSEASKRFQHGLSKKRLLQALNAAIKMYQELGGKLTAISIIGDSTESIKKISLSLERVNSLIGIKISPEKVEEYLTKLNFKLGTQGVPLQGWEVEMPYFRLDIEVEEDLIEEIARMYGYDVIPALDLPGTPPEVSTPKILELINRLKHKSAELGLTEVETYSYHGAQVLKALGFDETNLKVLVKIANPMSSETTYLRQNIWSNLIEVISKNVKQGFDDLAIFEIGKVFSPKKDSGVDEKYSLSIALMNGSDNPISELHSIFSKLNQDLNLGIEMKEGEAPSVVKNIFHPKRFIHLKKNGEDIGGMSEVHQRVLDQLGIGKRVAVLEVFLDSFSISH